MSNGRNSAFGRSLAPRLAILLAGVSLVLAACSTGEAPGRDYASGTVQVREFKDRAGEFAALVFTESDYDSVGSGVLTDDGEFTWNLGTPPETALIKATDGYGEAVTAEPTDVRISMVQEFYDESADPHIDHAVVFGTSSGMDEIEEGTTAGLLIYADKDATLTFASDYEQGAVKLHEGWNVIVYEIVEIDSDGVAHVRSKAGTAADLYFYHYYRDWDEYYRDWDEAE